MRRSLALFLLLVCLGAIGCESTPDPKFFPGGSPRQRFSYEEVKSRLSDLRPGMTRTQVMLVLGSPAEQHGDIWFYLPAQRSPVMTEIIEIRFKDGVFKRHSTRLVFTQEATEVSSERRIR